MNFFRMLGTEVFSSFCSSLWWLTVSKALLMSRVTAMVRRGGFFWLKPDAMVAFIE